MSDKRTPEEILASLQGEIAQAKEQQRCAAATLAERRELADAIRRVREFTFDDLPREVDRDAANQKFLENWAERLVELGRALVKHKLLERLNQLPTDSEEKRMAVEILRLACTGQSQRIVALLTELESFSGPPAPCHSGRINYWLRHALLEEILDTSPQSARASSTDLSRSENAARPVPLESGAVRRSQECKRQGAQGGQLVAFEESEVSATAATEMPRPAATNLWRKEGQFWILTFGGKTVRLKGLVGFPYIAELLSKPGRDIRAGELIAVGKRTPLPMAMGADDVLDQEAHKAYERRFDDLKIELEDARKNNDVGRQEKCQLEMASLLQEMQGARGLGGRKRQLNPQRERERKLVLMAISRTVAPLRDEHAELARHLAKFIRKGQYLCYGPTDQAWQF
jgi:hypothetical protein